MSLSAMLGRPTAPEARALPGQVTPDPDLALRADDLCRRFVLRRGLLAPARIVHAVQDVSLRLEHGRTLGIVGESGCGKTTLARMLTLVERPDAGTIHLDGEVVEPRRGRLSRAARTGVQMVFQDPLGSLNPRRTIASTLAEPLRIHTAMNARERADVVRAMIERVGLRAEHAARYPHMLSGGQRQRVAIARALMLQPRVVVADEPVSALDVSVRAQILNLLLDLGDTLGLSYVFISHDLGVVRHMADSLLVMYLGRVVEAGPAGDILARPMHPYTRALVAATPRLRIADADAPDAATAPAASGEPASPLAPPAGCAFHPRCPHAVPRCRVERPEARGFGPRRVACHRAEDIAAD